MDRRRTIALGLGFALVGMGVSSQVATLLARPPAWGMTEWEVAYFGEFSATLIILLLGIALLGFVAIERGIGWGKVLLAVVLAFVSAWAAVGALITALDGPLVWQAAQTAGSETRAAGLKIVTVKAFALNGWYSLTALVLSGMLIRSTVKRGR